MVSGLLMAPAPDVTLRDLAYSAQIAGKAVNRPIWIGVFHCGGTVNVRQTPVGPWRRKDGVGACQVSQPSPATGGLTRQSLA